MADFHKKKLEKNKMNLNKNWQENKEILTVFEKR
jgi:hypothetical protein